MEKYRKAWLLLPLAVLAMQGWAAAQACRAPDPAEFKRVNLIEGMKDPDHFAVLPDGSIFVVEQWTGNVWYYVPGQAAKVIGAVPTNPGRHVEDGCLGILADLDFARTGWLYIYHTPAELGSTRLERWTFKDGKLTNPKILLEAPRQQTPGLMQDQRHAGGGMAWNRKTGDLFLAIGDDTYPGGDRSVYGPRDPDRPQVNALRSSANTNDLRGKVLRIRPLPFPDSETPAPGPGATYAIPEGNLFPVGKYPADKTRPEIYAMGLRNAYRVKVDSLTGWAYVGEVGADANDYDSAKGPPGYDQLNQMKGPANFGWPFENGNLEPYKVRDYETLYLQAGYKVGQPFDPRHLKNLSPFNTGLVDLPPATGPLIYYCANAYQKGPSADLGPGAETIIAGPTYHYNPALASQVKLPPWFHRKVIFGDYSRRYIWAATLDANGGLARVDRLSNSSTVPIDMDVGPDGTLYVLDYGGTLYSLQYAGAQYGIAACPEIKTGCMDVRYAEYDRGATLNDPSACKTLGLAGSARGAASPLGSRLIPLLAGRTSRLPLPDGAAGADLYALDGSFLMRLRARDGWVQIPGDLGSRMAEIRFRAE